MEKARLRNVKPWLALDNYDLVNYSGLYSKKNMLSIILSIDIKEITGNTRKMATYLTRSIESLKFSSGSTENGKSDKLDNNIA